MGSFSSSKKVGVPQQGMVTNTNVVDQSPSSSIFSSNSSNLGKKNWSNFFDSLGALGAGAGQYTRGDWGAALGNANRSLFDYNQEKAKRILEQKRYEDQLSYQRLREENNNLFRDKQFNFNKNLALERMNLERGNFINSSKNIFLPEEITSIPMPKNEEERLDYIKRIEQINPNVAGVIKDISRYNIPVSSVFKGLDISNRGLVNSIVRSFNPDFDEGKFSVVNEFKNNLRSTDKGLGKDITRVNTALKHVHQLNDIYGKLGNSNTRILNTGRNILGKLTNNPQYDSFNLTAKNLATEMENFVSGSRPAVTMVNKLLESLSPDSTPAEFKNTYNTAKEITNARTYALVKSAYNITDGQGVPVGVFDQNNLRDLLDKRYLKLSKDNKFVYPIDTNKVFLFKGPDGVVYNEDLDVEEQPVAEPVPSESPNMGGSFLPKFDFSPGSITLPTLPDFGFLPFSGRGSSNDGASIKSDDSVFQFSKKSSDDNGNEPHKKADSSSYNFWIKKND